MSGPYDAENGLNNIANAVVELAKAIKESAPCQHSWSNLIGKGTFDAIQQCNECGEWRSVFPGRR